MASRTLNRRELRKQTDAAEQMERAEVVVAAPAKPKRTRKKKAPTRMCARWGVFDAGMKQVAIFDYNQRAAADQKLVELRAKKPTEFFVQIVKEPMPEPEPPPDAAPTEKPPAKARRKATTAKAK